MIRPLIFIMTVLFFAEPVSGEIFKWQDENGKVHFTDDISKVPNLKSDRSEVLDSANESRDAINRPVGDKMGGSDTLNLPRKRQEACLKRCRSKRYIGSLCNKKCGVQ